MKFVQFATLLLLLNFYLFAETVKDRAGAIREDRANMESDSRWIYNDWQKGFEQAKRTGRPLLVVLRCVPCLACKGIDAGVLTDTTLTQLLEQFVRVRLINANTLDLSLFQFDYDLSFSTMFFNGDGTIYGRFGSWTHQKNSDESDTAGFREALKAALEIHKGYPANKEALRGKQGRPMPVNDPLQLPTLAGKYKRDLDWEGKVVQSCVHCHQIGDAMRVAHRSRNQSIPRSLIYPMPPPETIGITLAPDKVAYVQSVASGSFADRTGLKVGDEFLLLAGQPLISVADFAWVLHQAPEQEALEATIKRDGTEKSVVIRLTPGWRFQSDISRRVGTWPMRAMALGGLYLEDLPDEKRALRKLGMSQMALLVKHAGEYGEHAAAKRAGFQKGDVLIRVDEYSKRVSESELIGYLLEKHKPGTRVKATILREAEQLELILPMQ